MIKFLKKAANWYLQKAAESDVVTPSCSIPLKYSMGFN